MTETKRLVAVIFVRNRMVLAEIRKANDTAGAGETWIPGGHVEVGESDEEALIREIDEEFGVSPTAYISLCEKWWERGDKFCSVHYYVCTRWEGEMQAKEAEKLIWLKPGEIGRLDEQVDREAVSEYLLKSAASGV